MIICLLCSKEKKRNGVEACATCLNKLRDEEYIPLTEEYRKYAIFSNSQFFSRIKTKVDIDKMISTLILK